MCLFELAFQRIRQKRAGEFPIMLNIWIHSGNQKKVEILCDSQRNESRPKKIFRFANIFIPRIEFPRSVRIVRQLEILT
jgi:hypothetical protein